jgi:hypothetical protein
MPNTNEEKINKERELIIARLEILSPEIHFSSGNSDKTLSRDEMIDHINKNDKVGIEFVKIELNFLRALKSGELMKRLVAD